MKFPLARGFWQLFKGYWSSPEKWKARGLLISVIALNLIMVYLLVRINDWYRVFYDALQAYDWASFWPLVGEFSVLAFLYIVIAVYAVYLRQMLTINWRTWMTEQYLTRWMHGQVYYRLQVLRSDTDNPDQRISEDINQFVTLTLTLLVGILKQLATLSAFAVVLWNLSGVITVPVGGTEFTVYGYMFWLSLLYSGLGTYFVHVVGKKLIRLNFDQQRYEADFRFSMMRVRENSESIAFYRGEMAETVGFKERFASVIKNYWGLMRRTKLLNFYVNGYSQLAIIFPLVMAAPRYYAGEMALGGLMQTLSAFGRVQDALSFFVDSYSSIAELAAVIQRLSGFTEHMEESARVTSDIVRSEGSDKALVLQDLSIDLPDGTPLLSACTLSLPAGSHVLVTGASGTGKSTLLRALAGIWPYGSGRIELPQGAKRLFLPQRPYLVLGSLRRALSYPRTAAASDDEIARILKLVGMDHFAARLDDVDDWSRILSLGEQQRLAFARILLIRPDWIFLDEATSALDEPRERALYELLHQELPAASIISVGHRSTLFVLHDTELRLKDQSYTYQEIPHES
ncbi:ABC transporter ATP-binding protein/permease [Selenomonas sp. oral taxon 138]|uniref:ABC transporter ATP-binding protein/permease n=1 Tax=Selenomonas sp. oral taxon 138 TaxID=712532 RepID=UPI00034677FE|nr:ABC transporter ATP-binding protein/permease [Selenomonas sp. oral taxon 138]